MENTTIDVEEVPDTGDYLPIDEEYDIIDEEEEKKTEFFDVSKELNQKVEKITTPYLTKYEKNTINIIACTAIKHGSNTYNCGW